MANMNDGSVKTLGNRRFLILGRTGAGKTAQVWTLPGKKFAYIFDPNAAVTLNGLDIEYQFFTPDIGEWDPTFKGFNRDSKSDRPKSRLEPRTYVEWATHIDEMVKTNAFEAYDWLVIDSLTHLSKAMFDRVLYLNNRYGDLPDLSDYRVVGEKLTDMFNRLASMKINLYCTGHINTFQDEKTQRVETHIDMPGLARRRLPLVFSDVLMADVNSQNKHILRTKPDPHGLKDIRTTIPGLEIEVDVTIPRFDSTAVNYGLGALLKRKA